MSPKPTLGTRHHPTRRNRRCDRRAAVCSLALLLTPAVADQAHANSLSLDTFAKLAAACAPSVSPETLAAVARTESGFDDVAIHDNTTGRAYLPATHAEAIALAAQLVVLDGHSVDLGLMQINSNNLKPLGLSISAAFNACQSMQAGARVLQVDYRAAMRDTLSRYNTGDPLRGIENGYVARVEASARTFVPSISASGGQVADSAPIPAAPRCPDRGDGWHVAAACAPAAGDWHVRQTATRESP
jgi:type IV secretion system protein VirB1